MRHCHQDQGVPIWGADASSGLLKSRPSCVGRKQRGFERGSWAKKFRPTFSRLHVLSYGVSVAILANLSLGYLLRVPNVGHVGA
jgi:hypothetical protein